ncbi:hypothetical protein ACRN9Z_19035 [Shewanella frigidimarina]|uniref:Uncharacterized protein n=1 Tax=Shewanella vesiculosa TaxID=518738 RepID=A0ABV0FUL8_9GAMM|nr:MULTISPECIES: hypothetical protein [unclassified Shewanella]MBB1390092.1 hypothetical protein [Shewanella sp. SG44-6]PIX69775.1 MAG: hypothetical protein COZ42_17475 [Shewanella sp. CG_4_10_14_3_um_filter_42_91]PIY64921.1 MAG: hypothetical protein COY92_14665 [Shewanella sp. CG_4_10_14_0_8_um_filter_42_13]
MSNKTLSSQAAYYRRRKQKILKKLIQIRDSEFGDSKFIKTSRRLSRTDLEMSQLMNLCK